MTMSHDRGPLHRDQCQLCLLKLELERAPGHDRAAGDYEAAAHRREAAVSRSAPWRTQCGRDQPLDWHDPHGALAAVEDARSALRQQEAVQRARGDEANRLVLVRDRREALLKTFRERSEKRRQLETALRSADPEYIRWTSQDNSPQPRGAVGVHSAVPPKQRPCSATATGCIEAPGPSLFAGWCRQPSMQTLTLSESRRLGVPSPRPTTVLGHMLSAHKSAAVGVAAAAADHRRATPLPSPAVLVRPPAVPTPPAAAPSSGRARSRPVSAR